MLGEADQGWPQGEGRARGGWLPGLAPRVGKERSEKEGRRTPLPQ